MPCVSPHWFEKCNILNTLCTVGGPSEGCDDSAQSCVNCYRGDDPPIEEGGNRIQSASEPYIGCLGLYISDAGFLSKFGLQAGDLLLALNKRPIRSHRQIINARKTPIKHIQFYRPSTDEVISAQL